MPTLTTHPSLELTTTNTTTTTTTKKGINLNETIDNHNSLNSSESPILIVKKLTTLSKKQEDIEKSQQQQQQQQQEGNQTQELSVVSTSAFQVLNNQENNLINHHHNYQLNNKPNAIVHPVQRSLAEINKTESINQNNFNIKTISKNDQNNLKKGSGLLNFAKELDFRLRRLKKDKNSSTKNVLEVIL